jgi:hypothetical protein
MKKFVFILFAVVLLAGSVTAATSFAQKADPLTPKNSGRVYEIGSRGFVIIEGKRSGKIGEKLAPRVVALSRKPLSTKESGLKVNIHPATSKVIEVDLLKFEF